jgi:hypothetical protein
LHYNCPWIVLPTNHVPPQALKDELEHCRAIMLAEHRLLRQRMTGIVMTQLLKPQDPNVWPGREAICGFHKPQYNAIWGF